MNSTLLLCGSTHAGQEPKRAAQQQRPGASACWQPVDADVDGSHQSNQTGDEDGVLAHRAGRPGDRAARGSTGWPATARAFNETHRLTLGQQGLCVWDRQLVQPALEPCARPRAAAHSTHTRGDCERGVRAHCYRRGSRPTLVYRRGRCRAGLVACLPAATRIAIVGAATWSVWPPRACPPSSLGADFHRPSALSRSAHPAVTRGHAPRHLSLARRAAVQPDRGGPRGWRP